MLLTILIIGFIAGVYVGIRIGRRRGIRQLSQVVAQNNIKAVEEHFTL